MLKISPQHGFSLVELMIAIVITAILLTAAMPSFNAWIQNSRIRTTAELLQNDLQLARVEAVRRNQSVVFSLGAATNSWIVAASAVGGTNELIQSKPSAEGSANVTLTVTPANAVSATFDGLGRIIANADGTPTLTQVVTAVPTSILPASEMRVLTIKISTGGKIQTCDPFFSAPDPRAC